MTSSLVNPTDDPSSLRHASAATLCAALGALRSRTLELFEAVRSACGERLDIEYRETVNPPLWELGHVGWFEEFWIARNSQRLLGPRARLEAARASSVLPGADAFYDSSNVAHRRRWQLPLPDERRTRAYLGRVRESTLALLGATPEDDDALYFFRLVLAHEAMHHEAGLMIAQQFGWPASEAAPAVAASARCEVAVAGTTLRVGDGDGDSGFAFDNELGAHDVELADFRIDSAPVTWREFLVHAHDDAALPAHVRRDDSVEPGYVRRVFGRWRPLELDAPAVHLTHDEAQGWCRAAGRRLPTEHEWTWAAQQLGAAFTWGQVWEWTASPFAAWPGFEPHPYRDYSAPWFDGRPVLKGGSFATQPFMKHLRYRNFFLPQRSDVFAGFRSCAV